MARGWRAVRAGCTWGKTTIRPESRLFEYLNIQNGYIRINYLNIQKCYIRINYLNIQNGYIRIIYLNIQKCYIRINY